MTLKLRHKIQYASGNFGKSILWNALELFFLFYLTDVLRIPPALAGMIVFISLVWDGITDPILGYWIDRQKSVGETYSLLFKVGPSLAAIAFISIFITPITSHGMTVFFVLISCLSFRTAYTLFDVPHNAMLARLTLHGKERTGIAALRIMFSSLGSATAALGIAPVLWADESSVEAERFLVFAVIIAICSAIILFFSTRNITRLVPSRIAHSKYQEKLSIKEFLTLLFTNHHALIIIFTGIWVSVTLPIFAKFLTYFAKYVAGYESWASMLIFVMMFGQIITLAFWTRLAQSLPKARVCQLAHFAVILIACFIYLMSEHTIISMIACVFFMGISIGGVFMLSWSMAPDVVESIENQHGRRIDAGYFAFLTLTQKVSMGVGAGLAGIMLEIIGYTPGQASNESFAGGIKAILCLMPMIGSLGALISLSFYGLNHKVHEEMINKLSDRQKLGSQIF